MKVCLFLVFLLLVLHGEMAAAGEKGEVVHFPFSRHVAYAKGTIRVSEPGQAVQDAEVAEGLNCGEEKCGPISRE